MNNEFLKNAFASWVRGYKSITPTINSDKSPIVKEWAGSKPRPTASNKTPEKITPWALGVTSHE
jgi:hypothetical protein